MMETVAPEEKQFHTGSEGRCADQKEKVTLALVPFII